MLSGAFSVHNGVVSSRRFPALGRAGSRISAAEITILLLAGAAAACASAFVRLGLRIPGHAIVLAVVPMALGMALAPRRLGGMIMGGGAFATASALSVSGVASYGTGAMTSLCLAGPFMDVALAGALSGWRLYLGLVAAGLVTNLVAFLQRAGSKLLDMDKPGTRLFAEWWPEAIVTYTVSGAVAGLLGALFWYRLRRRSNPDIDGTPA
jgi:hypothetical protein